MTGDTYNPTADPETLLERRLLNLMWETVIPNVRESELSTDLHWSLTRALGNNDATSVLRIRNVLASALMENRRTYAGLSGMRTAIAETLKPAKASRT
jgi:hypothetical protein